LRGIRCEASDHPTSAGRCWHLRAVAFGIAGKPTVRISQRPARRFSEDTAAILAALDC
jgi:hypothetical protein